MVFLRGAAVLGTCAAVLTTVALPTQAMPDVPARHVATAMSTSTVMGPVTPAASGASTGNGPVPGPTVFADRFEDGGMSAWGAVKGVVTQRRTVFGGSRAARARSTGGPAYARTRLDGVHTDVAYDLRFKIMRQGRNRVPVMTMRTKSRGALVDVYVTQDGKLALHNSVTGRVMQNSRRVRLNGWHRLRVRLHVDGARSRTKTRLDGAALPDLSGGARLGRVGVARVQLGSPARGRRFTVAFDNVRVVDTGPDTTDPTAPRNLTARVDSTRRVDLSWSAATDDFAVSGYTVYRDGTRIASLGRRTSYRDTDVRASTRYAYRVRARDAAGNVSAPSTRAAARTLDPVLAAAGDIACDPQDSHFGDGADSEWCQQMDTSDLLLRKRINRVLTLGDNQYEDGTLEDFLDSYDPSWGRVKRITSPAPGNHEYRTDDAAGYFSYFGAAAGEPGEGYYSFDLGRWHLIALNSQCAALPVDPGIDDGCAEGSPQHEWLEADLAAYPSSCTLAYWHIPPDFGDAALRPNAAVVPLWEELYAAGADVVLTGHHHTYARYAPLDASGNSLETGMRQFVVGTGGRSHGQSPSPQPAAVQRQQDHTYGVLRLTLRPKGYRWVFVPEAGKTFRDVGSDTCR